MNRIDPNELGTNYSVVRDDGSVVKVIKILFHEELMDAIVGKYDPSRFNSIGHYLDEGQDILTNFISDPLKVYWHVCREEDFELMDVIDRCIADEYTVGIIDIIEESVDFEC